MDRVAKIVEAGWQKHWRGPRRIDAAWGDKIAAKVVQERLSEIIARSNAPRTEVAQLRQKVAELEARISDLESRNARMVIAMLEAGNTASARDFAAVWSMADPLVRRWAEVLRPAAVQSAPATGEAGIAATHKQWLTDNRDAFKGQWVGLRGAEVIVSNADRRVVEAELRNRGENGVTVLYVS